MSIKTTFIYVLNDPRTNQIRYVGKADDPLERWKKHCSQLKQKSHKVHWIRELKSLGLTPELEVLESVPYDQWEEIEREYIRVFRMVGIQLTNTTDGGDCPPTSKFWLGKKRSVDTKDKISRSLLGKTGPWKGKKRGSPSKDTLRKMSASRLDMKHARASSNFFGVKWHSQTKRWAAYILIDQVYLSLGLYDSEIDAAITYDWVANLYGRKLNFPQEDSCSK